MNYYLTTKWFCNLPPGLLVRGPGPEDTWTEKFSDSSLMLEVMATRTVSGIQHFKKLLKGQYGFSKHVQHGRELQLFVFNKEVLVPKSPHELTGYTFMDSHGEIRQIMFEHDSLLFHVKINENLEITSNLDMSDSEDYFDEQHSYFKGDWDGPLTLSTNREFLPRFNRFLTPLYDTMYYRAAGNGETEDVPDLTLRRSATTITKVDDQSGHEAIGSKYSQVKVPTLYLPEEKIEVIQVKKPVIKIY